MGADPVEGMARALCWESMCGLPCDGPCDCCEWRERADEARAAWAYALARLREHWRANYPADDFLAEFERRMGLGGPQEPPGRVSGFGSEDTTSDEPTHAHGAGNRVSDDFAETTTKDRP